MARSLIIEARARSLIRDGSFSYQEMYGTPESRGLIEVKKQYRREALARKFSTGVLLGTELRRKTFDTLQGPAAIIIRNELEKRTPLAVRLYDDFWVLINSRL